MNTREYQLQQELRATEHSVNGLRWSISDQKHSTKERAHLQAHLDILERRAQTLRCLLLSVNHP